MQASKNPFAPTIRWDLHCQPNIWLMIEHIGFKNIRTEWTARRELRHFGKVFLSNRLCSYFLDSHFVSFYKNLKNKLKELIKKLVLEIKICIFYSRKINKIKNSN